MRRASAELCHRARSVLTSSPSAQLAVAASTLFVVCAIVSVSLGATSQPGRWTRDIQLATLPALLVALVGNLARRNNAVVEARAALYTARRPRSGRTFRESVFGVLARQGWTVTDYDGSAARWAVAERGGYRRLVVHTRTPVVTGRAISRIASESGGDALMVVVRRGYVTAHARRTVHGGLLDATALGAWLVNKRLAGRYVSRAHAELACGLAELGAISWWFLKWARRAWLG